MLNDVENIFRGIASDLLPSIAVLACRSIVFILLTDIKSQCFTLPWLRIQNEENVAENRLRNPNQFGKLKGSSKSY